MATGLELIAAEQQRVVEIEGYGPSHNAQHTNNQLPKAAIAYLFLATGDEIRAGYSWPWDGSYFRPKDAPLRALVKAGALIASEIDRRQQLEGGKHV